MVEGPVGREWYLIVRRDADGRVRDWVEVGECAGCGRGVDRDVPAEYSERDGQLYCRDCAATTRTARCIVPIATSAGPEQTHEQQRGAEQLVRSNGRGATEPTVE